MKIGVVVVETLDLESTAKILSIGMTKESGSRFIKFDKNQRRTANIKTKEYWENLPEVIKEKSYYGGGVDLKDGLEEVLEFLLECDLIFTTAFGRMVLSSALGQNGLRINYKKFMDLQTIYNLFDISPKGIKHDPEDESKVIYNALLEVFSDN